MKTITVEVKKPVSEELEKLHYEYFSRRDILTYMIVNNYDTKGASFKDYEAECQKAFIAYEAAKSQLQKLYVDPVLSENHIENATWNMDFDNCEVTISYEA